jgi:predicted transcriptional regulator of viral defense system
MEKVIQIFKNNKGYIQSAEITGRKMRYQLQELMRQGRVSRIKRGVYTLEEELAKRQMIDIGRIVPGGVLCLHSAWYIYNLSVFIPDAFYVAIEKSRKVVLPEFPAIKLIYLQKEYFELGIETREIEGISTKIYDVEKCVCDAVKYRNKIGMETTVEIIKNYLALNERNLEKLIKYAKKMRVYSIMKIYTATQL